MLKRTIITATTIFFLLTVMFAVQTEINAQVRKKDKKNAEKLLRQGNVLFGQNEFKAAIDRYAQAISMYPGFAEAHFWKGSAHSKLNETGQAIDDLDIALQQGYNPIEIYKLRWFLHYQRNNYDAALKDAEAGLKLEPNTSFFLLSLGDVYTKKEDYENAVISYEKAAPLEMRNGDLFYNLAFAYGKLDRYEKQEAAAQEALNKGTKKPGEAWVLLGDAAVKQKKYDQAVEAYERSIVANDKTYATYTALAETYRFQGNFKKAIATLEKGLKNFENDEKFLVSLTRYYSLAGDKNDAVRVGLLAKQYAPDNAMAFTNLCRAYSDAGLHQQALDTCKEALKKSKNGEGEGESHYYMGRAYEALKQNEKAVPEYEKAVLGLKASTDKLTDDADGFYLLGGAYYATRQYQNAIEAYQQAINLSPRFAQAYYNMAYAYLNTGDKKSARAVYEKLKDIAPKDADELLKVINSQ